MFLPQTSYCGGYGRCLSYHQGSTFMFQTYWDILALVEFADATCDRCNRYNLCDKGNTCDQCDIM